MVTGGKTEAAEEKSTILISTQSLDNATWTPGPDMIEARSWHACGTFQLNGTMIPVVAGSNSETCTTVEFLDLNREEPQWIRGPDLLVSTTGGGFNRGHHIVSNEETLFYINTIKSLILRLECSSIENCQWVELNRQFQFITRNAGIVALVPDELTDCSET